jgi:hypothetical protein
MEENSTQKNNGFGFLFLGRFFGDFLPPETKKLVGKKIPRFIRYKHGYGFLSPISRCLGVARAARRPLKNHRKKKEEKKLFIKPLV